MDRVDKFLRRVDAKLRGDLLATMLAIIDKRMEGLDIKPLRGEQGFFRCRVRDVRIIFTQGISHNRIVDVDFRDRVYRKRR